MNVKLILLLPLWVLLASELPAAVLVQWTFESSAPTTAGPHAAETGTGTVSGSHVSDITTYSSPTGNGSASSFASNRWAEGDYYQFTFSTLGVGNLSLSFDQGSSATGPGSFEIFYSVGGAFVSTGITYSVYEYTSPVTAHSFGAWSESSARSEYHYDFDLGSLDALENQTLVHLRLQMLGTSTPSGGSVANVGVTRIDNVTIHYFTTVPEPAAMLLGVVAFGPLLLHRRRS
ncbi:MAG: hypothetical protein QM627_02225 [Luteolibacter sp.]